MLDRSVLLLIKDSITSMERILAYIEEVPDYSEFSKNQMVIDAVTRNFEIIGEISNKLPKELKEKYPGIPWRQMYGLRNFTVHEYHIIEPRILWEIATEELVKNLLDFEKILTDLKAS